MYFLNSLLSENEAAAGAVTEAGMEAHNTTEVGVGVPLPSVGVAPASSSSLVMGEFQQGLQRAESLTIALAG